MKKILLVLGLVFSASGYIAHAQTAAAGKDFESRFTALFDFIMAKMSEADAKKTAILGASQGTGAYNVKQGLPGAAKEELILVPSTQQWIYKSELGKFKAGQEAAEKTLEEKLAKYLIEKVTAAGWVEVKRLIASSPQFRTVLHYRDKEGDHSIRLKVMKNSKAEDVIQLYLE